MITSIVTDPQATFLTGLVKALHQVVEDEKERVIKQAVLDFEQSVRQSVGRVAINLADYYSIQRFSTELVIHVKIEDGRESQA